MDYGNSRKPSASRAALAALTCVAPDLVSRLIAAVGGGSTTFRRPLEQAVEATLAAHPEGVTHGTAPHFYANDATTAQLNVALAERTYELHRSQPTRAILTISARNAVQLIDDLDLAAEYACAGVEAIEIRLSPLGGEDVSLSRIRNAYAVLEKFRSQGMRVTVGHCGTIGLVAVAMGHADAHSLGIGYLEKVDHTAAINRQARPPAADADHRGPAAGVYMPGIAATVPRKLAAALFENRDGSRAGTLRAAGRAVQPQRLPT